MFLIRDCSGRVCDAALRQVVRSSRECDKQGSDGSERRNRSRQVNKKEPFSRGFLKFHFCFFHSVNALSECWIFMDSSFSKRTRLNSFVSLFCVVLFCDLIVLNQRHQLGE